MGKLKSAEPDDAATGTNQTRYQNEDCLCRSSIDRVDLKQAEYGYV